MKTDIRALWTEALRSGKYEQGSGVLKTRQGSYCCLGVLCELAVEAGVIAPAKEEIQDAINLGWRYETESGVLPTAVMEWAGLPDSEGTYEFSDEEMSEHYVGNWKDVGYYRKTSLVNANDSHGKSFPQIADLIDKHF